jgi:hypothetical protein
MDCCNSCLPPPLIWAATIKRWILRDKSDLFHLTDGGDCICCRNYNNKEIGHASLHNVAMADHAYDADFHDYDNCDAPLVGLGTVQCLPTPNKG